MLSKTNLETHKLDLMAEISNLKLRLATSDKERNELREKLEHATVSEQWILVRHTINSQALFS